MRLVKCDICKKELASIESITEYLGNKQLDLCSKCSDELKTFRNDLEEQEKKLNREYEEKRKKIYESTITKYGLNKE